MIRKQFRVEKDGDWLTINTGTVDRDRDRVLPSGAVLENYLANPVVMWGHNYRDPWALIGRAADLELTSTGIRSRPEFREPASDSDPMHIIRALWDGGLVRAASIGFNPLEWKDNELGGRDYTQWELLEWSLVPVPANQEALRLAVKSLGNEGADENMLRIGDSSLKIHLSENVPVTVGSLWVLRDGRIVFGGQSPDDGAEDGGEAEDGTGGRREQGAPDAVHGDDVGKAAGDNDADKGVGPDEAKSALAAIEQFVNQIREVLR